MNVVVNKDTYFRFKHSSKHQIFLNIILYDVMSNKSLRKPYQSYHRIWSIQELLPVTMEINNTASDGIVSHLLTTY